jgi:uncharacterized protein YbjT (DUF2867 family)
VSDRIGRVLVIGATGSIGRLVVQRLLELGDRPRALTRDVERARRVLGTKVDIVTGDLTDAASLRGALEDVAAVVMTHGAPYGSGDYEAIDYGAVPALLEALAGRRVRVAFMSSIGVTGNGGSSRELLDWKRRGERLLRASGLPYTVARPGWFDAGSGREQHADVRQGDRTSTGRSGGSTSPRSSSRHCAHRARSARRSRSSRSTVRRSPIGTPPSPQRRQTSQGHSTARRTGRGSPSTARTGSQRTSAGTGLSPVRRLPLGRSRVLGGRRSRAH